MKRISLTCENPGKFFNDCKGCEFFDNCDYFQKIEREDKKRKPYNKKEEKMKTKKPYKKPEIKKVPLRPQESVLGFCKTSQARGPQIGTCTRPGACMTEGS